LQQHEVTNEAESSPASEEEFELGALPAEMIIEERDDA
jgi:hypothetical protein